MAAPVEKTQEEKTFFPSPLPAITYIFAATVAAAAALLFLSPFLAQLQIAPAFLLAILLLLAATSSAACIIASRSICCKVNSRQLSLTSGILSKETRSIPLSHIDNFSVSRSLLQNLLGLGTLRIDTPGGYGYEAELADFENNSISAMIDFISTCHKAGAKHPNEA